MRVHPGDPPAVHRAQLPRRDGLLDVDAPHPARHEVVGERAELLRRPHLPGEDREAPPRADHDEQRRLLRAVDRVHEGFAVYLQRGRWAVLQAFGLTVAFSLTTAALGRAQNTVELKVGDQAPNFSLRGSDGKTHTLAEYKGKSAVVLAWFPKAFTGG